MTKLRRYLRERSGLASLFIILYCLIAFAGLCAEYFRVIDLREEAENILQRGVNVALEDMLRDSYRRDFASVLNTSEVWERLDRYLRDECGLDSQYRKLGADGSEVWRIEFTNRQAFADPGHILVAGNVRTQSIMSLLAGEIRFPFSISSRAARLD